MVCSRPQIQLLRTFQFTALVEIPRLNHSHDCVENWAVRYSNWNNEVKAHFSVFKWFSPERSWLGMPSTSLKPAGWHLKNCCKFYCMPWLLGPTLLNYYSDTMQITLSKRKAKGAFRPIFPLLAFKSSKKWECQHLNFKLMNLLWIRGQLLFHYECHVKRLSFSQILPLAFCHPQTTQLYFPKIYKIEYSFTFLG